MILISMLNGIDGGLSFVFKSVILIIIGIADFCMCIKNGQGRM